MVNFVVVYKHNAFIYYRGCIF